MGIEKDPASKLETVVVTAIQTQKGSLAPRVVESPDEVAAKINEAIIIEYLAVRGEIDVAEAQARLSGAAAGESPASSGDLPQGGIVGSLGRIATP